MVLDQQSTRPDWHKPKMITHTRLQKLKLALNIRWLISCTRWFLRLNVPLSRGWVKKRLTKEKIKFYTMPGQIVVTSDFLLVFDCLCKMFSYNALSMTWHVSNFDRGVAPVCVAAWAKWKNRLDLSEANICWLCNTILTSRSLKNNENLNESDNKQLL